MLVLGGTRSGKSVVAEQAFARLAGPHCYVSTASFDPDDEDMAERIARHRRRRPASWTSSEAGADLAEALRANRGSVLVDALGTWVASNDLVVDVEDLCLALLDRAGDTVLVSDEVGMGVHPSTEVGRRFRDVLGEVNQAVAGIADHVFLVVAGRVLPLDAFDSTLWITDVEGMDEP
ncbi:MAG: bifunctional adenosylcobinamide kinase/adenosylcobinamide-phosphate guanylyltransferase [Acidimicrobiales bacterium]